MDLARNLKVESVSRLQPTAPWSVEPDRPVQDAVELMRRERIGCLLVVEKDKLIGIFTERDLMSRVLAPGRPLTEPVSAVMTANPVIVSAKDPISVAIRRMQEGRYRHLPVVDEAQRPVGVLSSKRVVHYLVEHFPSTVYNLPPDPGAIPHEREGA